MQHLPLFPLPLVLFPGSTAPLHIFEPRYRRLVEDCLATERPFGLVYHDPDEQGPFLMEEGRVGTLARITEHRALPEGRSLILARGDSRFAIQRDREMEHLYYEADVLPYEDASIPRLEAIREARARTLELFVAVMEALDESPGDTPGDMPQFDLNLDLSFQLAPAVHIDLRWQQSFLELRSEPARLERLDAVFQAAVEARGPDIG